MSLSVNLNQIKPDYTSVIASSTAKHTNMAKLSNTILTGNTEGVSLLGSSDMSSLTKTMLGSGNGNTQLTDYAAIKNGSYGKLMKAYYKELAESKNSEKEGTEKTGKDEKKETSKSDHKSTDISIDTKI